MFCSSATFKRQILKFAIVRLDQIGKSRPESIVVGTNEWVQAHQIDVVLNHDQVTLIAERIQSARGIGNDQELAAKLAASRGSGKSPATANSPRTGETAPPSR